MSVGGSVGLAEVFRIGNDKEPNAATVARRERRGDASDWTESDDSPAVQAEASQGIPLAEGMPTGFAHGACPPGLAHRAHPQGSPSADTVARRERRRHASERAESDDSPAVLVTAPQDVPSAEGLPTGFAHGGKGGERPPGEGTGHIARARRKRKETDAANCQTRA